MEYQNVNKSDRNKMFNYPMTKNASYLLSNNMLRRFGLLTVLSAGFISGCSSLTNNPLYGEDGLIRDRSKEYQNVGASERLIIPPHLNTKRTQEIMELPERNIAKSGPVDKVERPDYFYADTGTESVNFKQEAAGKVLIVDSPINQIWPKAQQFMDFNNLGISKTDPQQGAIESDWVIIKGDEIGVVNSWLKKLTLQTVNGDSKNKIRIELKPLAEDNNRTAISMKHVSYPADEIVDNLDWDGDSKNISYKNDMLYELLRFMSKSTNGQQGNGLLASTFERSQREGAAFFGRNANGKPALKITGSMQNAWQLVDNSLMANDIDVGTRDRENGTFYLTFTSLTPIEEEKRGFFDWLHGERGPITFSAFGFGSDDDKNGANEEVAYSSKGQVDYGKDVLLTDPNHPANQEGFKVWLGGKVLYNFNRGFNSGFFNLQTNLYELTAGYQLRMVHRGNSTFLTVLDKKGEEAATTPAEELLWRIKDGIPRT
jgi:uncharacterized lipoprotein